MKSERGQSTSGIGTYVALGIGIFTIVLLFFVFAIASSNLQDADPTTTASSLNNETLTLVTSGNQTSGVAPLSSVVVTNASGGEVISSANYTIVSNNIKTSNGSYYGILNITSGLTQSPVIQYIYPGVPYNVSSSPIYANSSTTGVFTTYWDLPSGINQKGMIFITFSQNATHYVTQPNTGIDPYTNGTIQGYSFHAFLANNSQIGNFTVIISQGHYISNQSGTVYLENGAGSKSLWNNLFGQGLGNATIQNFKYNFFINSTATGGNYTHPGLSNWTNGNSGLIVVANTTYNTTIPFLQYYPNNTKNYNTNLTTFRYFNVDYNDNITGIDSVVNVSYWLMAGGQPFNVTGNVKLPTSVDGTDNINIALINVTDIGDGYSTFFVSNDTANNCADINTTLSIPLSDCVLFINNYYIANGFGSSYTRNVTALNNWISSYNNKLVNISASFDAEGTGSAILGNYTEALSQQSDEPGVWLTVGGLIVILSIIGVVILILRNSSEPSS